MCLHMFINSALDLTHCAGQALTGERKASLHVLVCRRPLQPWVLTVCSGFHMCPIVGSLFLARYDCLGVSHKMSVNNSQRPHCSTVGTVPWVSLQSSEFTEAAAQLLASPRHPP